MNISANIPVTPYDLFLMLSSTIRYSFGRRTHMSEDAGDLVLKYEKGLHLVELEQIAKEIKEELRRYEAQGKVMGMQMDHTAWKISLRKIENLIEKRRNG